MKSPMHAGYRRATTGQALAEGAAILVALGALAVGLSYLLMNTNTLASNQQRLQVVANESAKLIAADQYFLGMQKSGFNFAASTENAREAARILLNTVGLGNTTLSVFNATQQPVTVGIAPNNKTFNIIKVDIGISGVKMVNSPNASLSASGIASNAAQASANLVGSIYFYNPSNPADSAAFYMPLYGIVKNSEVTGENSETGTPLPGIPRMGQNSNMLGFGTVNVLFSGYAQHNEYQARTGARGDLAHVGNVQPYCQYNGPYAGPPPGAPGPKGPPGPPGPPGAGCP